jgi:ABC-2 type transport system ATP-binding protein
MSDILLQIKNVKKKYGSKYALKGVSFDIKRGEVLGLLGVNGAGKTTLSSILATLHPATEGDILYEGKSIYSDIIRYRLQLGFCPQQPNLNDLLTLWQNLFFAGRYYGMSKEATEKKLNEVVEKLGLSEYLSLKASELSGGYKQRFMIARSLIHSPRLLLLDEPTVGLDPHIRRQLWDIIKMLQQDGVTVILTTHYLDEAQYLSDRVCILDKGQVKLIDTPDNLMADFKQKNLEEVFIELMKQDE